MSTAAEKRWMSKVAESGCLICGNQAQVHHLQCFKPRSNCGIIALCPEHHTGEFSIHRTKAQFMAIYGDEMTLMAKQIEVMA